jgi:polygalacturonase
VRQFGTIGDGKAFDTQAIQSAIDAANQAGGGVVSFPAGIFLSASLVLKSHVELRVEAGATLLGSEWLSDYPKDRRSQAFLMAALLPI